MSRFLPSVRHDCCARRSRRGARSAWWAGLLLVLPGVAGCGREAPPAHVEGTLCLAGEPLDHCLVTFLPDAARESAGPHSSDVTDEQGHFRLRLPDQREGASTGWHCVTIEDLLVSSGVHHRDHGEADRQLDDATPPPVRRSRVPAKYNAPADTPLRREVHKGEQVIDLEIP